MKRTAKAMAAAIRVPLPATAALAATINGTPYGLTLPERRAPRMFGSSG